MALLLGSLIYGPLAIEGTVENQADQLERLDGESFDVAVVSGLEALAYPLIAIVLLYLYRTTRHRRPELPGVARIVAIAGPAIAVVATVASLAVALDLAGDFTSSPEPRATDREAAVRACRDELGTTPQSRRDFDEKYRSAKRQEPFDRCLSSERAQELLRDGTLVAAQGVGFAGRLALAFALVLISLNAMRAGLLSRFMGILGIIIGALNVLPLLGELPIVQLFWFGALGVLFLGRWPGGRGPAWESGEAEPWPSAAEVAAQRAEEATAGREPTPDEPGNGEPAAARRRKKKKKR